MRAVYPASLSSRALARPELLGRHGIALPGFDGSGVTVALLDTGVDGDHPALRGRVQAGVDLVDGDARAEPGQSPDGSGALETHGTRMAGILVGPGRAERRDGRGARSAGAADPDSRLARGAGR